MPILSIITPTYNRPGLLAEAIQSVLAQTFTYWEMLIIEDRSDGSARSVVAGFNDPRLRYIYQDHAGRSAARNRGLAAAVGEFIAFLDDDDLYHPHKLAKELDFLAAHPNVDLVGSGYRLVNKAGDIYKTLEPWLKKPYLNQLNVLSGCPVRISSVLIKHDVLDKMDHWFDPAFDLGEDTDFFLRLLLSGARFAWLKEVLSDYRLIHERPSALLLDQHQRYQEILQKLFNKKYLSPDQIEQISEIQAMKSLKFALIAYALHKHKTAQHLLLQALIKEPGLVEIKSDLFFESLMWFSQNSNYVEDPMIFLDYLLGHLPPPLQHLAEKGEVIKHKISPRPDPENDIS